MGSQAAPYAISNLVSCACLLLCWLQMLSDFLVVCFYLFFVVVVGVVPWCELHPSLVALGVLGVGAG